MCQRTLTASRCFDFSPFFVLLRVCVPEVFFEQTMNERTKYVQTYIHYIICTREQTPHGGGTLTDVPAWVCPEKIDGGTREWLKKGIYVHIIYTLRNVFSVKWAGILLTVNRGYYT